MNKIIIKVEDKEIDLLDDVTVQLNLVNPVLSESYIAGSHSWSIKAPRTALNHKIFDLGYYIENSVSLNTSKDGSFEYGSFFMKCKIKINNVSKDFISFFLLSEAAFFGDIIKNTSIKDLGLDLYTISPANRLIVCRLDGSASPTDGDSFFASISWSDPGSGPGITRRIFYEVDWDTDKKTTLLALANRINSVNKPPVYNAGVNYSGDDIVKHPTTGRYFGAVISSTGQPLTDPSYWYEFDSFPSSGGYSGYEALFLYSNWPGVHNYDHPDDENDVQAIAQDINLILVDNSADGGEVFENVNQDRPLEIDNGHAGVTRILITGFTWIVEEVGNNLPNRIRQIQGFRNHMNEQLGKKWPDTNLSYFPIYNPEFFDANDILTFDNYKDYVNYFDRGGFFRYSNSNENHSAVAFPYLFHVLDKIANTLNVSMDGRWFDMKELQRLIILNNYANEVMVRKGTTGRINIYPSLVDLANHVPNLTISEFLNAIRSFFFTAIYFDNSMTKMSFKFLQDILKSSNALDLSNNSEERHLIEEMKIDGYELTYQHDSNDAFISKSLPGLENLTLLTPVANYGSLPTPSDLDEVVLVIKEDQCYISVLQDDYSLDWELYSQNLYSAVQDGGELKISPSVAPCLTEIGKDRIDENEGGNRQWIIPSIFQPGTSKATRTKNSFSFRLAYYRGMQNDSLGNEYPLGTPWIYNYNGDKVGVMNLRYSGQDGILEKIGNDWLSWYLSRKIVRKNIFLSAKDLQNISPDKKILIDGNYFMWERIKIRFPIKQPAVLDLIKANYVSNDEIDLDYVADSGSGASEE